MQRLDFLIRDAGFGDIYRFKDGARIHGRERGAGGPSLSSRASKQAWIKAGEGAHINLSPCHFAELNQNCGTELKNEKRT